jgi:hypothetical protein
MFDFMPGIPELLGEVAPENNPERLADALIYVATNLMARPETLLACDEILKAKLNYPYEIRSPLCVKMLTLHLFKSVFPTWRIEEEID